MKKKKKKSEKRLFTIYLQSIENLYIQYLNVKWSGSDSISQNFTFRVKLLECISHLSVGKHSTSIIYSSEPPIDPGTILFR